MAVLICGGAGYIGSHVNKMLSRMGRETVVFDNLVYGHREAVMHFAAYAYVGESVIEPEKYYMNSVACTLNLLHAMRVHGCNKIIFSSTCATYGEPERVPITEDMPQEPINPYGRSKLMVEKILEDYGRAYGLKYAALRYFNAVGANPEGEIGESHDPETHLIPLVLDAASGKRPDIKVFGKDYATRDGNCIRDYIHVNDLGSAHILALDYLEKGKESGCFNLGNEKGTSVLEVIEAVWKVTGKDFPVTLAERCPGDPATLVGGSKKARKVLGWKPEYGDIETIVEHAWKWHQSLKKIKSEWE